jgi:hypothetical protein
MRRVKPAGFVVVSVVWLGAASALGQIMDDTHAAPDQPVHVRVHAAELQKEAIPPTIFANFLEPIGHSTYGGLWSELLENGSFEEGLWSAGAIASMIKARPELERASKLDLPLPWEPLDLRQENRYEPQSGDNGQLFGLAADHGFARRGGGHPSANLPARASHSDVSRKHLCQASVRAGEGVHLAPRPNQ